MTTAPFTHSEDGLAPVRSALLARARAEADRVRGEAESAVTQAMATAQSEADAILAHAHEEALEQGRSLRAAEEAHGRRKAREVELAARREAYDALVDAAGVKVRALLEDPKVVGLLTAAARRQEGAEAQVTRTDDGVVVNGQGRKVEFSLAALADQAITDVLRARGAS